MELGMLEPEQSWSWGCWNRSRAGVGAELELEQEQSWSWGCWSRSRAGVRAELELGCWSMSRAGAEDAGAGAELELGMLEQEQSWSWGGWSRSRAGVRAELELGHWSTPEHGAGAERHGYCTLGEAFNRLDFSSAIKDIRRFNYVVKLLQLIAKSQLTSLSGAAQKNYFNVLEKIVRKVLEDQQNPRLIKDLLQDLGSTLCILIREVGKSVLVGNINIWICRLETILNWQQQLNNFQIPKQVSNGITLDNLPLHMQNNILYKFSDGWDIVNLGQVTSTLHMLSEDWHLWKKLCQYHFAEKQQVSNGITLDNLPLHMQNNILYKFSDGWDIVNLGQVTSTLHMLSEDWHLWKKLCQYHFAEKQCRKGDIEQHWLRQSRMS
ncbi:UNVERIFIED_CONTAM: hypothetical protein FKN15_051774 [Acipenser sinensis]